MHNRPHACRVLAGALALIFSCWASASEVNMLRGKPSKEQIIEALSGEPSYPEAAPSEGVTTPRSRRTRGLSIGPAPAANAETASASDTPGSAQATPLPPTATQAQGAPRAQPVIRSRALDLEIQFGYDSHQLTPDGVDVLEQLGQALQSDALNQVRRIVLEGHTDANGSAAYNLGLSLRRAQSAQSYLAQYYPAAANKIRTVGKGMAEPADPQHPRDAINRRVRVILED